MWWSDHAGVLRGGCRVLLYSRAKGELQWAGMPWGRSVASPQTGRDGVGRARSRAQTGRFHRGHPLPCREQRLGVRSLCQAKPSIRGIDSGWANRGEEADRWGWLEREESIQRREGTVGERETRGRERIEREGSLYVRERESLGVRDIRGG